MSSEECKMADFTAIAKSDTCKTTMAAMWQHQRSGQFTDFCIKVKGQTIECHRVVIAAACPYFETLLNSAFKERDSKEICMDSIEPVVMRDVVNYMYGQNATFSEENLVDLVDVAELLQLHELKEQVTTFLCEQVSCDKCLYWYKVAVKYNIQVLRKITLSILTSNAMKIMNSDDFKELDINDLQCILCDEDFNVEVSCDVLEVCLKWVSHDVVSRQKNITDILTNMKLDKCSLKNLQSTKNEYHHVLDDELIRMIDDGIQQQTNRTENPQLVLLGGYDISTLQKNETCLVTTFKEPFHWEGFVKMQENVYGCFSHIVVLPDGFLVFSELGGGRRTSKYTAHTKAWSELPPVPDNQNEMCLGTPVLLGRDVYLVGCAYKCVHRLDLNKLSWHQEPNTLCFHSLPPICATLSGTIYAVEDPSDSSTSQKPLEALDCKMLKKCWRYRASVPREASKTHGASLVPVNTGPNLDLGEDAASGCLYLVGGENQLAAAYHPLTNAWTLLEKRPLRRHYQGDAVIHDGRIYIFGHSELGVKGGRDRGAETGLLSSTTKEQIGDGDVSVFDNEKEEWSVIVSNLPFVNFAGFKMAVVQWI